MPYSLSPPVPNGLSFACINTGASMNYTTLVVFLTPCFRIDYTVFPLTIETHVLHRRHRPSSLLTTTSPPLQRREPAALPPTRTGRPPTTGRPPARRPLPAQVTSDEPPPGKHRATPAVCLTLPEFTGGTPAGENVFPGCLWERTGGGDWTASRRWMVGGCVFWWSLW